MKVLLVRPPITKKSITLGDFMFAEPIGLECMYTILSPQHEVRILDLMAENEDLLEVCRTWRPEVVGFTSLCVHVPGIKELAAKVKAMDSGIITLVGGTQALLEPESFFTENIDHIAKFTTVSGITMLLQYLALGADVPPIDGILSRKRDFVGTGVDGVNEYIIPDRTSTKQYRHKYSWFGYTDCAIMQTSRGCSSRCTFCLRWLMEGKTEIEEPLNSVVNQLELINESNVMIFDNNFLGNGERLENFCRLLEYRGINKNFLCYGSVKSIVENRDAVARFAQNGLKAVIVGFESFNQTDLKSYNKKATPETNLEAAKILKGLKVDCWGSFILHPDWTTEDFSNLRKFAKLLSPEMAALTPLTLFSYSPLYKQYADRIIYRKDDYDHWSFSLVSIRPSRMSLRRFYFEVLRANIYVNMFVNKPGYMVNKYGLKTIARILFGSLRFIKTYIQLMIRG